jgi:CspA family cold shock protein
MLKIVQLLAGVAALLLSFLPSLTGDSLPYLLQPDALYLALFGLLNLAFAALPEHAQLSNRRPLQILASVLLIIATAVQAAVLLAPLEFIAGLPGVAAALPLAALAVLLHLLLNWQPSRPARRASGDAYQAPLGENRETGTVKWFNTTKGFGFISRDSGDDIFVHFRAIRGEGHRVLVEGQRVEFSVMQRDKGLQAEDVVTTDRR